MATRTAWGVLLAVTLVGAVVGATLAGDSNAGFADNASVLAFVTLLAVAIERALEVVWSIVTNSGLGGWWPMKQIRKAASDFEDQVNGILGEVTAPDGTPGPGPISQLRAAIESARDAGGSLAEWTSALEKVETTRLRLATDLAQAKTLAPGSARLALVADANATFGDLVKSYAPALKAAGSTATTTLERSAQAAEGFLRFIDAVDGGNPGRRIASILLGSGLGMAVAGFMGVNLFAAILENEAQWLGGTAGILLTGVVIGLGSNPTHEIIKALQRYKESKNPLDLLPVAASQEEGTARATTARRTARRAGMDLDAAHIALDEAEALVEATARPTRGPRGYAIRSTD